MTSSAMTARPSPLPLPRSRSHGGWGADSSDRPGRRNRAPRTTETTEPFPQPESRDDVDRSVAGLPGEFIEAARAELLVQRTFRLDQVNQVDIALESKGTDAAQTEIHVALRAGARSVLDDIDRALHRIQQGKYGRCPRCGDTMSPDRLRALPMAPLCGRCQRTQDEPECLDIGQAEVCKAP
jgi:DnaK suppressor protein